MKIRFILLFVAVPFITLSQDSLQWKKIGSYSLSPESVWNIDVLQNVYVIQNRIINKYDSTGSLRFSQSIKSLGQITEILPINAMKLVLFSEDQQVLCMLDNTLTMSEELIDLSEYGIVNATLVATSSQPQKIWVLDQSNSRLLLLDLSGKMQFQEVRNLKAVLNVSSVTSMVESNNHLFLLGDGSLYEFDIYGTLISQLNYSKGTRDVEALPVDGKLYWVVKNELLGQDLKEGGEISIQMPVDQISNFKKWNEFYYFQVGDKILKYAFKNVR